MRGPKKHLKRLHAPSRLMLSKLGGIYAPRSRAGPHKLRESMPMLIILRNRLKYALTAREAVTVVKSRAIKVDGVVRTDVKFPVGFMDVVGVDKTNERFRMLYDPKGRFTLSKLTKATESGVKLCRVQKATVAPRKIPFLTLHDGKTIKFPDPRIRPGDTVVYDIETRKMKDWIKFKPGVLAQCTGGANTGRCGEVCDIERHPGSFDIVHIKDKNGSKFATRAGNVFVVGASPKSPVIELHKSEGIRLPTTLDREAKMARAKPKKSRR